MHFLTSEFSGCFNKNSCKSILCCVHAISACCWNEIQDGGLVEVPKINATGNGFHYLSHTLPSSASSAEGSNSCL
ncbi:hypothetical protein TNCT_307451 [Trichonephila clavata]|uniref:Uncharacterized protein n=1 Tax=Trichonephila clavata TaxID=2740835 RepID=A0A8X6IBI3_TRICU|nr:hypothetical protein TNCT_307451 [Trichonephila clavata]